MSKFSEYKHKKLQDPEFKKEYDAFWTPERLAKADAQGLTRKEVSIMASIVSGETRKEFEYPVIAGVYLNRYNTGMKLQADPTICFICVLKVCVLLLRYMQKSLFCRDLQVNIGIIRNQLIRMHFRVRKMRMEV